VTAMTGRDGVMGAAAALNGRLSLYRAVVQIDVIPYVVTSSNLKKRWQANPGLRGSFSPMSKRRSRRFSNQLHATLHTTWKAVLPAGY
jgi:hypothetical protein